MGTPPSGPVARFFFQLAAAIKWLFMTGSAPALEGCGWTFEIYWPLDVHGTSSL